jgi:predicted RNA-binding Zn ribbon-like protein
MVGAMANRSVLLPAPDADVCLAFANTRYWRGSATPTEELREPDDVLRWAEETERLPPALVKRVDRSGTMLADALGLRETIHRCFAATAAGRTPDAEDLAALNAALAAAPARRQVRPGGWEIEAPEPSVNLLLTPVLWSAADLLVGRQLARVRQCANPACGWLFLDDSKSGNRRWCSMSACGNRAKAHRHYQRQKAG